MPDITITADKQIKLLTQGKYCNSDIVIVPEGGVKLFAAIGVTYPAGSTVICTNGTETLVANTTSGQWVFAIPEAGTWSVSATLGTNTKSQNVIITTEGQFESVTLSFALIIYENGVFGQNSVGTSFSAAKKDDNSASSLTREDTYMLWECGANAYCMFYITPKLSCAGYNTLNISVTNASMTIDTNATGKGKWGLSSSTNVEATGFVATKNFSKFSGSKTLSLDVSNVDGTAYYIALQFGTPVTTGSFSARVTKIWLE